MYLLEHFLHLADETENGCAGPWTLDYRIRCIFSWVR